MNTIKIRNIDKVETTLNQVQKLSKARTITIEEITGALGEVEERLHMLSTKKIQSARAFTLI